MPDPTHVTGAARACLQAIQAVLDDLEVGRVPQRVAEQECTEELRPLARAVNHVIDVITQLGAFVPALARGELDAPPPTLDFYLADALRQLQSGLLAITRQAKAVAGGDFTRRVEPMGELSEAFNSMAELLAERESSLRAEIAARRSAEERLQRERDLLVAGPLVTFRWGEGPDDTERYVSPNLSQFGYRPEEFQRGALDYYAIVHSDDLERVKTTQIVNAAAGLDRWTHEYRVIDGSGATRWIRDYDHVVRDPEGSVLYFEGHIIDITAQKAAEAELRRREGQLRTLSLTDELTGLYNRRGMLALGEHVLRGARLRKTGVLAVAVNVVGLHGVNDGFGNERGDELLRRTADLLRSTFREADVLARTGGDDFVALVEDDEPAAAELKRRLQRRAAAGQASGRSGRKLKLSLGSAYLHSSRIATLQELLDEAEASRRRASAARPGAEA